MTNKELQEKMFLKKESSWITYNEQEIKQAFDFCEGYKIYIDRFVDRLNKKIDKSN